MLTRLRRLLTPNAIYFLLYATGVYGLVLWPPIANGVVFIVEPLRLLLASHVERVPLAIRCVIAFVAFDFASYWVHRAAHSSTLLWRFHRIHHSDPILGPFTTFRFHVVEIAWRMTVQFVPLYLMSVAASIPPIAWLALLSLNVLAHSSFDWTFGLIGRVVVSPAYHGVHHRSSDRCSRSNFGMYLAIWDWLFGTRSRHENAKGSGLADGVGVPESIAAQFVLPFRRGV